MKSALLLAALAMACASAPPPAPVIVERPVYVYVPEKSGPPVPPGEGIAPSPLLEEAERRRAESMARIAASQPREPDVVYVESPTYSPGYGVGYGLGWRDPYPSAQAHHSHDHETTVVVVDGDRGKRKNGRVDHHGKGHRGKSAGGTASEKRVERAVQRCDGRATKWARERCYRSAAK